MDKAAEYDDSDVRGLLNTIVNATSGDGNALRTSLDTLSARMGTVETAACGPTCPAGQRVTTECDIANSVETTCSDCSANTYSFGGLVSSCLACDSCSSGHFETTACTTTSNRVCRPCTPW